MQTQLVRLGRGRVDPLSACAGLLKADQLLPVLVVGMAPAMLGIVFGDGLKIGGAVVEQRVRGCDGARGVSNVDDASQAASERRAEGGRGAADEAACSCCAESSARDMDHLIQAR